MNKLSPARHEAPSGRQFELRSGRQRAVVVEVGGGLREYDVDGQPVLDGYTVEAMADGGRGQPLLPWPNRTADGLYEFGGQRLQLPIEEVARRNAVHGLTRWANWNALQDAADRVEVSLVIHPRPGYPFSLQLAIDYALGDAGLTVRTTARNIGEQALPFGAGQHPYLTVCTPLIDQARLCVPATRRLELDRRRRLPTGRVVDVAKSEFDFREPRPIGPRILDDCFTSLSRDAQGRANVILSEAHNTRQVVLWMDEHYKYVQVFSGDTLAPERRRRGLAVEPMTCPPNALRTATDLIVLQPDASITLEWGISPSL
jgi:aldose 1-epimerase